MPRGRGGVGDNVKSNGLSTAPSPLARPRGGAGRDRRRFAVYWLGQTLSGFGDAFAFVALPLLVLEATGSIAAMGLVSAAGVAAQLVSSLVSGTLVDRLDRRRLMAACDIGRAAVYAAAPIHWLLVGPSLPLLYAIAVVGGALGNVFSVAYLTAVPALVGRDRLHSANARLQGALALSYVLGSMAAGAVCAHTGAAWALLVDGATFLLSAGSLALIRFDPAPAVGPGAEGEPRFGAGLRFLARHRMLRTLTILMIALGLTSSIGIGTGVTDLIIFHLKHDLALGDRVVGLCMGTAALGAVLGAASAPMAAKRIGPGRCFLSGTLVQALGLLTIGVIPAVGAATAGGFLWGAGMMLRSVPLQSLRQTVVPHALLGRVTAVSWMLIYAASALGTTIVTRAAASAGASATLTIVGALVALITVGGALGLLRSS